MLPGVGPLGASGARDRCVDDLPPSGKYLCRRTRDERALEHRRLRRAREEVRGKGARAMDQIVRARGVRKVYRNGNVIKTLKNIDLDIPTGELVAIVGA